MPERRLAECTNLESPDFALKKRKLVWDSKKKDPSSESSIMARSVPPANQLVFQPELSHKRTDLQPFLFDSYCGGKAGHSQ